MFKIKPAQEGDKRTGLATNRPFIFFYRLTGIFFYETAKNFYLCYYISIY